MHNATYSIVVSEFIYLMNVSPINITHSVFTEFPLDNKIFIGVQDI